MAADSAHRRDFLKGRIAPGQQSVRPITDVDRVPIGLDAAGAPQGGDTLRLTTKAMACEFSVILNPGSSDHVIRASTSLDVAHDVESLLTVYRDDSLMARINREAASTPVPVPGHVFELLTHAVEICHDTQGAFDLTSGPLIARWRACRAEKRVPSAEEITADRMAVGMHQLQLHDADKTVRFANSDVTLNFGAIGKGFALDQIGAQLSGDSVSDWLLHGGHSSILARGEHHGTGGWPIGIGNPLFTDRRLGTILLSNQAMGTSGSNIQHFHHAGRRYGHILDPRTGWPVEGVLSVTAVAPNAAIADALSTAFYVLGLDETRRYCAGHPEIGAIVIPFPSGDRRVQPVVMGIDIERLFWDPTQVKTGG